MKYLFKIIVNPLSLLEALQETFTRSFNFFTTKFTSVLANISLDLRNHLSTIIVLFGLALTTTSCTKSQYLREVIADEHAFKHNFQKKIILGGDFYLTTYQKLNPNFRTYTFYIEGDGDAFVGKYIISDNPTPGKLMLFRLAALDDAPNLVYIARPCQYTPMSMNQSCIKSYWTDRRMSEEVVDSIDRVINKIAGNNPVRLIGFSGGGGVAVLIAARNPNVKYLITVAGNLDHEAFNRYHNVRPMIGSLNPIDYAEKINHIPQLHVSGAKDLVVPAFIADDYIKASKNDRCIKREIITDATHTLNWEKSWEYILNIPLTCQK
ncbi:MAG: alpha/beta hydrolase [Rickettsiaceae bacterium]|nr:alpha/beta hydrolase [Rickettsiaceae bacterium]